MFRFTIRDMLWLTVVVAVSVGWWLQGKRCTQLADELKSLEPLVEFERQQQAMVQREAEQMGYHIEKKRKTTTFTKRKAYISQNVLESLPPSDADTIIVENKDIDTVIVRRKKDQ